MVHDGSVRVVKAALALLSILVVSAPLAACGGDDDGGEPEGGTTGQAGATGTTGPSGANLPKPPSGKATVGGEVTKDGKPVTKEDISLNTSAGKDRDTKTDKKGKFLFERVAPGRYTLNTGITLKDTPGTKCKVPGYQVLAIGLTTRTGEQVTIASLESKPPFDVAADARILKDITVTC